jgi:transcriptional regulator with XRE-family HTH domain
VIPSGTSRTSYQGLAGVTLSEIAKATGMSTSNAAMVRSGKRVPHPRPWDGLQALVGG